MMKELFKCTDAHSLDTPHAWCSDSLSSFITPLPISDVSFPADLWARVCRNTPQSLHIGCKKGLFPLVLCSAITNLPQIPFPLATWPSPLQLVFIPFQSLRKQHLGRGWLKNYKMFLGTVWEFFASCSNCHSQQYDAFAGIYHSGWNVLMVLWHFWMGRVGLRECKAAL